MIAKGGSSFRLVFKSNTKTATSRDRVSPAIVVLSSSAAVFLPFLPFGRRTCGGSNEEAAPATIYGGLPSSYHAFVVSIMFAFSSAFSAMFLRGKPLAARVFRFSAVVFLSSAFLVLIHAIFCNHLS